MQIAGSSNIVLESDDTAPLAGDDLGQLDWYNPASGGNVVGRILVESDATWSGGTNNARISFHVKQGTSLTERLTILSSGNVGIGTTGPNEKTDCCGRKQCFRGGTVLV